MNAADLEHRRERGYRMSTLVLPNGTRACTTDFAVSTALAVAAYGAKS